jgi:signal peptidase I
MSITSHTRAIAAGLAILAATAALWILLGPTQLGGSVDYAVIHGISMQPKLHAGDLTLLRSEPSYRVGQVVGYRSGLLHELVLHRIIGFSHGRYVFKGDHNNFVDAYYPTSHELVGRLWLRIPYAGALLAWLQSPRRAAILGGLVALMLAAGGTTASARRSGRGVSRGRDAEPRSNPSLSAGRMRAWLIGAVVVAAGFAVLAFVGFTRSTRVLVSDPSAYDQTASYAYSAAVARSTIYPDGTVHTGDPIYLNLVPRLALRLHYRFSSQLPHAIGGTLQLHARLRSGGGWTQQIAAVPTRAFRGDTTQDMVSLNLAELRSKMRAFQNESGVTNESFTLEIASHAVMRGTVNGRPVASSFAPTALTFNADDQSVELAQAPTSGAVVGVPAPDPLTTTIPGSVDRLQPASLSLHGVGIGVRRARQIGLIGMAAALLAAAAALALLHRSEEPDELEMIKRRCRSWLMPVVTLPVGNAVDVASIDSLVSLAEHYQSPILYEQRDNIHTFAVVEADRLYRYQLDVPTVESPEVESPTLESPTHPWTTAAAPPIAASPNPSTVMTRLL